jgi:hypothetical protein
VGSNLERLISYHLARLNDQRVEVRLETIEELRQLEAASALDALKQIYEHDPDPRVRRAAQVAGRDIFRATQAGQ